MAQHHYGDGVLEITNGQTSAPLFEWPGGAQELKGSCLKVILFVCSYKLADVVEALCHSFYVFVHLSLGHVKMSSVH